MKKEVRKFKFVNKDTEHVIFYYSLPPDIAEDRINLKLEKVRELVAIQNKLYVYNIYWLENKESDHP